VTGRDGALYFAERNADVITRMTTTGQITGRTQRPAAANAVSLAPTRNGLYISAHSLSAIGSMSYFGALGRPVRTKSAPDAITVDPDGNLWYASGNESKIGRLELG
jgi:streptogramin lyase